MPATPRPPAGAGTGAGTAGRGAAAPRTALAEALGGPRGLIDSGLPTLVFVVAKLLTDTRPAVLIALAAGLAVAGLRLARRQPLQQAVGGLFGLALAAFLAVRLNGGDGTGFFLPGVLVSGAYAVAFAVSLVIRRPLTGVLLAAGTGYGPAWREIPRLRRAHSVASMGWLSLYASKAVVQGYLLAAGYGTTELGVVRLVMGYPLFLGGLGLTYLYLRSRDALLTAAPVDDAPPTRDALPVADDPAV